VRDLGLDPEVETRSVAVLNAGGDLLAVYQTGRVSAKPSVVVAGP
jgi:hypothetical protein